MRVLWLCNIVIPLIADKADIHQVPVNGGWLTGFLQTLLKNESVELCVVFPEKKVTNGIVSNQLVYYSFKEKGIENRFDKILDDFLPEVVHIWGTEFPHSLYMVQACKKKGLLSRVIISIQGMVSVCAKHYYADLPVSAICAWTMRDLIRRKNIWCERNDFKKRGFMEKEALEEVSHLIGRTDWDLANVKRINPNIKYHFCNETLRNSFYNVEWNLKKCERYSIFVSQCGYPIKGFHMMLEALVDILKVYPDTQVYTTGVDIIHCSAKSRLKQSSYIRYLAKTIKKNNLSSHVHFVGVLDEQEMCNRYLKANVFVSCSSIENSPNSVGEAMLVGCPVVTSDVGGVKNMLIHGEEGYVYPFDEPYMLAFYVMKIFGDEERAKEMSYKARGHALKTHDRAKNQDRMFQIYNELIGTGIGEK